MIIRTQCGDFDLSAVEPESIRLTDLLALRNVCRWGGHTIEHYSVVQHSVLVARLVEPCYFWHALLHDAPEAYIGDIPTPLKRTLHQLHEIEDRLWLAVAARFSIDPVIPPEVHAADRHALYLEAEALGLGGGWHEQYREPHLPLLPLPAASDAHSIFMYTLAERLMTGS